MKLEEIFIFSNNVKYGGFINTDSEQMEPKTMPDIDNISDSGMCSDVTCLILMVDSLYMKQRCLGKVAAFRQNLCKLLTNF